MKNIWLISLMIAQIIGASLMAQEKVVHGYNTVIDLLSTSINPNDLAGVEGLIVTGDGGGGMFRYYPTATDATNATTVFQPYNGIPGRWILIFGGPGSVNTNGFNSLWTNNSTQIFPIDPTKALIVGDPAGNRGFFSPAIVDGSTPYVLDTTLAHTSGRLAEVKNFGTNRFTIDWLGNVLSGYKINFSVAPTISSSGTIAPVSPVTFISGTTTISTITAPSGITTTGGSITLIPTGLWVTDTGGNVAIASTAVVSKALILTYDHATLKWYPSY